MTTYTCRQKMVKVPVPVNYNRVFVQDLKKGDRVSFPTGCTATMDPVRLPDELFQHIEHMPTVFKKLPFAFSPAHAKQEQIQKILQFSFKQQKEDDVSYFPAFICTVIEKCLKAIDVPCQREMGFRTIDKDTNPHMWLDVDGVVIDNTYEKLMTKKQISSLEMSTPGCYKQLDSFLYPSTDSMPKGRENFSLLCYKKRMQICKEEPDKGLALGLNQEQLYMYYYAMIRFMWETFGVNFCGINPAIRHYCWSCGKFPLHASEFLTDILPENYVEEDSPSSEIPHQFNQCSQCMFANYCSTDCQQNDWKEWHRFICMSRVSGSSADI